MLLRIDFEKAFDSLQYSPVRYLQNINFKWNPSSFKALGIIFSTDLVGIIKLNFISLKYLKLNK